MTSTKARRVLNRAGLLLLACTLSAPTHGWEQSIFCNAGGDQYASDTYTFNISTTDFATSGPAYPTIHQAGALWDGSGSPIPGTSLEVARGGDCTVNNYATGDGYESITSETLPGALVGQSKFGCLFWEISECDIRFESAETWYSDPPTYGATGSSRRNVMAHEVGHCLGFDHENQYEDTMNDEYPGAGNIGGKASISEGARDGARSLYPDSSTGTDVAHRSPLREIAEVCRSLFGSRS